MSSFGELVRQHRERNGMNKQTFAERVGIDIHYVRQLETGQAKSPSAIMIARMVTELHLTPFQTTALLRALRADAESKKEAY